MTETDTWAARAHQLFERYGGNPILAPHDWPYPVNAVFNPGVTIGPDGETVLLVRVEDRSGLSHLTVARSEDGLTKWKINQTPTFTPDTSTYEESSGIEDARITRIGDRYLITYTAVSAGGPMVGVATTDDFADYERVAIISPPENKDAALFPELFDDRYVVIHRPVFKGPRPEAHMWISFSPDIRHWGDHRILLQSRAPGYWDSERVGLGPPPLRTERGWLLLYHGVKETVTGSLYRAGLAVLDLDDPTIVLARTREWVLGPEAHYESQATYREWCFPPAG